MLSAYFTAPGAAMARLFSLLLLTCAALPVQAQTTDSTAATFSANASLTSQ